jgi:hypothetical protein
LILPPILLLAFVVAVTCGAAVASRVSRKARAARVAKLAAQWGMSYTADDRFRITPIVAASFPTPGVADVVLRDLLFNRDAAGGLQYVFTVEYTTGVLRTKRRRVGVARYVESHVPGESPGAGTAIGAVALAPADLTVAAQYEHLARPVGPRATETFRGA